ncbi:MAG: hypothetical protein R3Y10_09330 [Ferrimonas sp.]
MANTSYSPLMQAIQTLVQQGKSPTIALLKSRVGPDYPLPQLIEAIRRHKANAPIEADTNLNPPAAAVNEPVSTVALQQQIHELQLEIQQLQQRLAKLEAKQ